MNDMPTMTVATVQELYPYLRVRNAADAIAFYKQVFGAQELYRLTQPDGRIGHIELKLGPATLMVSDEYPEYGIRGPGTDGTGMSIHLHVDNVDGLTRRASAAGATVLVEPRDQFWGERISRLRDPFGHEWLLGQHIEDVTTDEMQRRFTAMFDRQS